MREPEGGGVVGPVFFLDRNLGHRVVAKALREAGALVEEHAAHFKEDALDQDWLPEVGAKGWAVITQDNRIRYREAEKQAVHTAKVALFIITSANMRGAEIATALVKMQRLCATPARRQGYQDRPRYPRRGEAEEGEGEGVTSSPAPTSSARRLCG